MVATMKKSRSAAAAILLVFVFTVVLSATVYSSSAENTQKININKAGTEELAGLPGIGASKAERIISYRAAHGPFRDLEEILSVRGIGPGILEKIKNMIVLVDK